MTGSGSLALDWRRHHLELHWARGRWLRGKVLIMVIHMVVYDNRLGLGRRSPRGRTPIVTDAGIEALVDVVRWAWCGSLITWLGPATTVVEADVDIVPVVVASVTHRELDGGELNFLWVLIEMKQESLWKPCNTAS